MDCDYNRGMQITGSNPVLAVHDLEGSAEWFRVVLGCERTDPDPGNWVFCRAGAVTLMLGLCPDALPAAELGDHSYVAYLTVDSVDAFYARAVAAGCRHWQAADGRAVAPTRDGASITRATPFHARRGNLTSPGYSRSR
jgi:hypothetical protein